MGRIKLAIYHGACLRIDFDAIAMFGIGEVGIVFGQGGTHQRTDFRTSKVEIPGCFVPPVPWRLLGWWLRAAYSIYQRSWQAGCAQWFHWEQDGFSRIICIGWTWEEPCMTVSVGTDREWSGRSKRSEGPPIRISICVGEVAPARGSTGHVFMDAIEPCAMKGGVECVVDHIRKWPGGSLSAGSSAHRPTITKKQHI